MTAPESTAKPVVHSPGQSRTIHVFGDEVTFHLTGEQTGGRLVMFTDVTPPGGGPPPHRHLNEDEWWFVLEGQASFLIEGQWRPVAAGSAVFAPKGSVHTFRNDGKTPLRQLVSMSPAGFETFFSRCAVEFAKATGPDLQRIVAIGADHGIQFVNP